MKTRKVQRRKRFFAAVEGDCEVSFLAFLQKKADECDLSIHIDKVDLNGGGYEKMLSEAIGKREKRGKGEKDFLIVDADRSDRGEDSWSIDKLEEECNKNGFILILQKPNFESGIARLFKGNETKNFATKREVNDELSRKWPEYQKTQDAQSLGKKFTLEDVIRLARHDTDLKKLLETLGFEV